MTEPRAPEARRKPTRPALASRILAVGASAAATIGLVGAMAARTPAPATQPRANVMTTPAPPRPLHIVVVIKRQAAFSASAVASAPGVMRAPSATRAPVVIPRYVPAPPVTATHGS